MALSDEQRRRMEGMAEKRRAAPRPKAAGAKGRAGGDHAALAGRCRDALDAAAQARRALAAAVLEDYPDRAAAVAALNSLAARHGLPEFDLLDLMAAADTEGEGAA